MFNQQHTSTRSVPTTVEEGSSEDSPRSRSSPEDGDDHSVESSGGAFCIGTPNASVVGAEPPSPGPVDEEDPSSLRLQTTPMKPPQDAPAASMTKKGGSRSFPVIPDHRRRQTMCMSDYTEKPDLRRKDSGFVGMTGTLSTLALGTYHPARMNSSFHADLANFDDNSGHYNSTKWFWQLLLESIDGSYYYVFASLTFLTVWSCLCAWFASWLAAKAKGGDALARGWLLHIQNCRVPISILGTLFTFTLIFRFNSCYDRWWEARKKWGDMISRCLDMGRMNRCLIANQQIGDRMSRFIVAYAFATKALLRGSHLGTKEGEGAELVKRGILAQEELDALCAQPCWQPHFCVEILYTCIIEAHKLPRGSGMVFDLTNKIHGEIWQCFDAVIREMSDLVGDCVRIRASGLPASYDGVTNLSFFVFFIMASFIWSTDIGWMTPIIVAAASFIILLLIVMGTNLVDPFGYDKVDIPLEDFCETIEAQIYAIDERHRNKVLEKIFKTQKPQKTNLRRSSTFFIPELSYLSKRKVT